MTIALGPVADESLMYANPSLPRFRIEAHVVEVRRGQGGVGPERDRDEGLVRGEVDADELRPARLHPAHVHRAGVERPEPVLRVDDDALHADERRGRLPGHRRVPLHVREGNRHAALQLSHARLQRVGPAREAHEDAPLVRHRDAGGHRAVEGRNPLQRRRCRGAAAAPARCSAASRARRQRGVRPSSTGSAPTPWAESGRLARTRRQTRTQQPRPEARGTFASRAPPCNACSSREQERGIAPAPGQDARGNAPR